MEKIDKRDLIEKKLEPEKEEKAPKRLGESQAIYLHQAEKLLTEKLKEQEGLLFDPTRYSEEELSQETIDLIADIVKETTSPWGGGVRQDFSETLREMGQSIGAHAKLESSQYSSENFDSTQRSRKFFEIQPGRGAAKRETYWNTLFFQYDTKATRALAKEILDGKEVVLLGGGRSKLTKELEENEIYPAGIVNVDPFVEDVEDDADKVLPFSACDARLVQSLEANGVESADEIWAEYSVPAYLNDPGDIKQLFINIDALLKEGGTARIWPLQVGAEGGPDELAIRKEVLVSSVEEIVSGGDYEMSLYKAAGREGLVLYKKKKEDLGKEVQDEMDMEQVEKIRGDISQIN